MKAWFDWKAAKTEDSYIRYSRRHIHKQRERLKMELGLVLDAKVGKLVDAFVSEYTASSFQKRYG